MKKRRTLFSTLILLLLIAATAFVILREHPLPVLAAAFAALHPAWLLLGLFLMSAFVSCESLSTRMVLRALGSPVSRLRCLGYAFAGFYFSSVTPLSAGGQPMQIYYMSRDGIPAAHGTLAMLLDSVSYQVVTVLYAVAALLFFPHLPRQLGIGVGALLILGGALLTLASALILAFMFRPALATRLSLRVLTILHRLHIVRDLDARRAHLEAQIALYQEGARFLQTKPRLLPAMLALNAGQLTLLYLIPVVIYHAFGLTGANIAEMVAIQALVSLALACLPVPGAVGIAEGAYLRAFALYFSPALTVPAMIAVRGISFYAFLLIAGGVTAYVHYTNRGSKPHRSVSI